MSQTIPPPPVINNQLSCQVSLPGLHSTATTTSQNAQKLEVSSADKDPFPDRSWQSYRIGPSQWHHRGLGTLQMEPLNSDHSRNGELSFVSQDWVEEAHDENAAEKGLTKKAPKKQKQTCTRSAVHMDAFEQQKTSEDVFLEMLDLEETLSVLDLDPGLPSMEHYTSILQTCRKNPNFAHTKRVHTLICNHGLDCSGSLQNHVVPTFIECGSLFDAQRIFIRLAEPNEYSWTSLLSGYIQCGQSQHALNLYQEMQEDNVHPSAQTFMVLLKACARLKDVKRGRQFHTEIAEKGFLRDTFVASTLIDMYAKCGSLSEAQEAFDKLSVHVVVSWNALIAGYSEHEHGQKAITCYEQMQLEGVSPDAVTFASIAKACGSIGAIDKGREIHKEIVRKGFGRHLGIGNTLIGMYAKLGLLSEAREAFDNLPARSVVSWTALISGYAEHGSSDEALKCFQQMQLESIPPDSVTYACSLKACSTLGAIDTGREIHKDVAKMGLERDSALGNTLVAMYAKCGSISEAQEVFDKLATRDGVSWTAMIAGFAESGLGQKAIECFEQMQLEGVLPDAVTFICVVKACGSVGTLGKGREIHKKVTRQGFESNLTVCNTLIGMYAKCGSLSEAREVFDKLQVRDVVSWNALIAGYAEHGPGQEALKCLEEMLLEGTSLNAVTYACIIKACGSIGAVDKGRELHKEILRKGLGRDLLVGNTLIGMYAKCGTVSEACEVFEKLPVRDVTSWNALIAGYAEQGPGQEVLNCFEQMQLEGVSPDAVTFACVFKACSSTGSIDKCREIHEEARRKGFERDLSVGNSLIGMYGNHGLLLEGREVFDKLPVRDIVSWTALVAGYAEHGYGGEAVKCFKQMQLEGIIPDMVIFPCILKACGNIGALDTGREIHMEMTRKGIERDPSIGESLSIMYARCGLPSESREVFDQLLVQDVVAWSSLIRSYGLNHQGNEAIQSFEDMQKQGVKPDIVTFTCLLTACSHSSLVCKGWEYFKAMREKYGIIPTTEHYTCIADLLARSGLLHEAEVFIEMLCPSCEGAWAALLSACKTHGRSELGLRCLQKLVQMNMKVASWYVLMADIYAGAGMLDYAYRLEELRKHARADKKVAIALIEVNKKVYEFVVGNNPSTEIAAMLTSLNARAKEQGHKPNVKQVLRPIPNKEKEALLCEHAEKLAIAFGLLNTPQGQTLRVTKNLRMCNDCHNASKIISQIERREIVLRDDCCIHRFKDGLCSCDGRF